MVLGPGSWVLGPGSWVLGPGLLGSWVPTRLPRSHARTQARYLGVSPNLSLSQGVQSHAEPALLYGLPVLGSKLGALSRPTPGALLGFGVH